MTEPTQPQGVNQPSVDPNAQLPTAPQAQFAAPVQGAPVVNQATEAGKGLSIAGIICGIFAPLIGLILGIIGMNQNKQAGGDGKLGKIAIIISIVFMVLGFIFAGIYVYLLSQMTPYYGY